ncbi:hypothetical protein CCR96_17995 [Halochromatium roseum]|nr:hypothetical protein [Halochromatium roseum]
MRVNLHNAVNDMAGVNVGVGRFGARQVALGEAQPPRAPDAPKGFGGWLKHYAARAINFVVGWTGFRAASRQAIAHERIDYQVRAGIAALTRDPPDLATAHAKLDMDALGKLLTPDMHGDAVLEHLFQQLSDMTTAQFGKLGEALALAAQGPEPNRSALRLLEQMRQKVLAHDLADTLDRKNQSLPDKRSACRELMGALGQPGWDALDPRIKTALSERLAFVSHDGQTQVIAPPQLRIHNPSAEQSRLLNRLVDESSTPAQKLESLSRIAPSLGNRDTGSLAVDTLRGKLGAISGGQLQVLAHALDSADIRGLYGEMARVLDGGLEGPVGGNLILTLRTIDTLRMEVATECNRRKLAHPLGERLMPDAPPERAEKYADPINRMVDTMNIGQAKYHDRLGHGAIPRELTNAWLGRLGIDDAQAQQIKTTDPFAPIPNQFTRNAQIDPTTRQSIGVCEQFWKEIGSYPIVLNGQKLIDPSEFKTLDDSAKDARRMAVIDRMKKFVDDTPELSSELRKEKLFQLSQLLTQGIAKSNSLGDVMTTPQNYGLEDVRRLQLAGEHEYVTQDRFVIGRGGDGTIQVGVENRLPFASLQTQPSRDSSKPSRTIPVDPLQSHVTIHTDIRLPNAGGPPTLTRLDADLQIKQRPLT